MRSAAHTIKGQGIGACYEEQVKLIKERLSTEFEVTENARGTFDLVHYHTVNPNYFVERLLSKHRTIGVGYVHFLPDSLEESIQLPKAVRKLFTKYMLSFYNSMDYLITENPAMIEKIRTYGITAPELLCIPNFVSSEMFYPMEEIESVVAKRKLGIPTNRFIVLGVGQLQPRKGIVDFVETAKRLPEMHFIWAGGFSFGKISEGYDEIKELMKAPPPNVQFLGMIDREEMPWIYNTCDVLFLPSSEELLPMSILEALSCKKPILLRDIPLYEGTLFEYYLHGNTDETFAESLQKLAEDQVLYQRWCEKAWEGRKLYLKEQALAHWENFYRCALKNN